MKHQTISSVIYNSLTVGDRQLRSFTAPWRNAINVRFMTTFFVLFAILAANTYGQDITMPTVEIEGIDDGSTGDAILIVILKWIGRVAIWAFMCVAGFVALKTILKSWNAQKNNDEGRWGAVVSDSIGSVVMALLVIALGTWLLTFLA